MAPGLFRHDLRVSEMLFVGCVSPGSQTPLVGIMRSPAVQSDAGFSGFPLDGLSELHDVTRLVGHAGLLEGVVVFGGPVFALAIDHAIHRLHLPILLPLHRVP